MQTMNFFYIRRIFFMMQTNEMLLLKLGEVVLKGSTAAPSRTS